LAESPFTGHFHELAPYRIWEGTHAHAIRGRNVQLALVDLPPNTAVQEHRHPNEQIGFILQGSLAFTIGGELRDLQPGDTYVIPGDVPHSAVSGAQGCVAIDVFSPPREDWERLERPQHRKAAWPAP
jgi:unsaturated pyranuronate lyase